MKLLDRLRGSVEREASFREEPPVMATEETSGTMSPQGWLLDSFGGVQSRVKTLPRVTPEIAQRHATVFACCNLGGGDLSKIPLLVAEKNKVNGRPVFAKEHGLNFLLNVQGSEGIPAILMRYNLIYSFMLRGNGHAFAPRDGGGEIELIEYVHNDLCQILRNGRDRFYDFEDGAGVHRRVPSRSMVHLRYQAQDGWTGRSPLQVAAESVGLALAGQEAAARTASGNQMRGYVKLEDNFEGEEARARGIDRIREMMNNPQIEGWPVLGPEDEVKTMDLTAADQELLSSRKFDREQLAAIYRVPPSKLQMLEHGVKANGQQQAIDYKTDFLTHWGAMSAQFMSTSLLTAAERARGLMLTYDYDALLEATTKERYDAAKSAVGGPWKTLNEQRESEGLAPITGGDVLYPPPNMTRDEKPKSETKEAEE